ncbi:acyl-CoA thioesterase domain-containing protein [Sporichthya polymorpha]|uniref:acyl-CoA thioesterase domain-containing protein n=1 Tax=Sporichthya polymorpha TaxID=35751 RepID=UPI00048C636B|nr:acyl-CoA thioesterase domain-containing protein [Sporichthya polymorpha]
MPDTVPRVTSDVLSLEQLDELAFEGWARRGPPHQIYGGQVVAHALLAAARTVPPGRMVHSLHSQFLERGNPREPIRYYVTRVRDGGTFTSRQTVAVQAGRTIFTQASSFQEERSGITHQLPRIESLPDPAALPSTDSRMERLDEQTREWWRVLGPMFPMEIRFLDEPARACSARGERVPPRERFYVHFNDGLSGDAAIHAGALAYLSDLFLLSASVLPHGLLVGPQVTVTSLDHCIWFHRQVRGDEWLLHDIESSWAGGGRALARGHIFAMDGGLVATTMQEGVIRSVG